MSGRARGSALAGSDAPTGPQSQASPWLAWLLEQREQGLSAKRIHQDLLVEYPAARAVSYDSVRRLLKKHGGARPVPFRRMESLPGFDCLLYTSPSPRDGLLSRMPSSA